MGKMFDNKFIMYDKVYYDLSYIYALDINLSEIYLTVCF